MSLIFPTAREDSNEMELDFLGSLGVHESHTMPSNSLKYKDSLSNPSWGATQKRCAEMRGSVLMQTPFFLLRVHMRSTRNRRCYEPAPPLPQLETLSILISFCGSQTSQGRQPAPSMPQQPCQRHLRQALGAYARAALQPGGPPQSPGQPMSVLRPRFNGKTWSLLT